MKCLVSSLPSKGLTLQDKSITEIDLKPLTYRQLVQYTNRTYENTVDQDIAEIELFIMPDIPVWNKLSAYDLSSILFTRKYISATYNDDLILTDKFGAYYKVPISDITFKDINEELLHIKSIEINDKVYPFKVPTIEDYYNTLVAVSNVLTSQDFWLNRYDCMILASIGTTTINARDYINAYANASGDDIITIKYLDKLLNNTVNDVTVKGKKSNGEDGGDDRVISINKLIPDIFRLIQQNRLLNTSKIKSSTKVRY